ncbi:MAG: hypothetical protein AB1779_08120 [Candidatus Thermoplasmatota archaeon]
MFDEEKKKCYEFNPKFEPSQDDMECEHCRKYLTTECPHLEDFMEVIDELEPE